MMISFRDVSTPSHEVWIARLYIEDQGYRRNDGFIWRRHHTIIWSLNSQVKHIIWKCKSNILWNFHEMLIFLITYQLSVISYQLYQLQMCNFQSIYNNYMSNHVSHTPFPLLEQGSADFVESFEDSTKWEKEVTSAKEKDEVSSSPKTMSQPICRTEAKDIGHTQQAKEMDEGWTPRTEMATT